MAKKIINVVYDVNDKSLLAAKKTVQDIEKETAKSEKGFKQLGESGSKAFGLIGKAVAVLGLAALGKQIFDLGVKQEQLNIAFNTFLGSAEKGKKLLKELAQFAIVTPFTPDQVNNAAKALLAFGVKGKEVIPILKMLGDVSSGTGKDLTEMAVIFGQIRSTGRLMGQDLLQLINAGFNPLQVISEKTGQSMVKLKKDMENGLISFEMVSDAFKTATSDGGLFFNLMEKQSQTIGGIMSTIEGNIEEGFKNIFTSTSGPLKDFVDLLAELSVGFVNLTKSAKQFSEENQDKVIEENTKNFQTYVDVLGDANDALEFYQQVVDRRVVKLKQEWKVLRDVVDAQKEKSLFDSNPGNPIKLAQDEKALQLLADQIDAYELRLIPSLKTYIEEKKNDEKATDTQIKKAKELSKEWKANINIMSDADFEKKITDAFNKSLEENQGAHNKAYEQINGTLDKHVKKFVDSEKKKTDESKKQADERREYEKRVEEARVNAAIDAAQQILYASILTREEDFTSREEYYNKEIELAGDNENSRKAFEQRKEIEETQYRQRQLQADKNNTIKKILIDTAANIVRSIYNNGGIPLGLPFGAIAAGLGALQVATVRKYKDGGWIEGPGSTTSDSVPIMASRDEFMVNAKAASGSKNLLEAINDRKIDDRILQVAANGGTQVNVFDDSRLIAAIERNKVDYDVHGYTLMKSVSKGKNFKLLIRSKNQGY